VNKKSIITLVIFVLTLIAIGGLAYRFGLHRQITQNVVLDYLPARDREQIVQLFKNNWYWLIASHDFSVEFMLDHRAPDRNPLYTGSMKFNLIRVGNDLAGFIAYYMKASDIGWILFLVVDEKYRGKGYSDYLMHHAIDALKGFGAKKVRLLTRIQNIKAQKVYRRLGFTEYKYDPTGFLYFEYIP
jgi:ribosomal protein S18 acetylase RimI-like enzyme